MPLPGAVVAFVEVISYGSMLGASMNTRRIYLNLIVMILATTSFSAFATEVCASVCGPLYGHPTLTDGTMFNLCITEFAVDCGGSWSPPANTGKYSAGDYMWCDSDWASKDQSASINICTHLNHFTYTKNWRTQPPVSGQGNRGTSYDLVICSNIPQPCTGQEPTAGGINYGCATAPPLISGTANPAYVVLLVAYAPPGTAGKDGSLVDYEAGSTAGTSLSVSKGFKNTIASSAGAGILGISSDQTFNYSQSLTNEQSIDVKKSSSNGLKIKGPPNDGILHDYDMIYVWLN